jgi:hypothetical protein
MTSVTRVVSADRMLLDIVNISVSTLNSDENEVVDRIVPGAICRWGELG